MLDKRSAMTDTVRRALAEDIGDGDATTTALVPAASRSSAILLTREDCIVCGTLVAQAAFRLVDPKIRCVIRIPDGKRARAGQTLMKITGPTRGILTAERTALNFAQRMTGIATLTGRYVAEIRGSGCAILDTRKTTPLLRVFEKYAVKCGGGRNHRMGLSDMVLIKDNHRAMWGGGLDEAVLAARRRYPGLKIEVEVESVDDLKTALKARPEWILLDNMAPALMRRCVSICNGKAKLEASGGITLANVAKVALTGVDAISIGALTHSVRAADLSLEIAGRNRGS